MVVCLCLVDALVVGWLRCFVVSSGVFVVVLVGLGLGLCLASGLFVVRF